MSVGINIPVETIEELAASINSEAEKLNGTLNELRTRVTRDQNFTGPTAQKYDEFLAQWDGSQANLLESLRGAASILASLASVTRENAMSHAQSF